MHGLTETVTGIGWIDHQWANLPADLVTWEWFGIQLDDQREIMVADAYIADQLYGNFLGGMNYYDEDCTLELLPGYDIQPLTFWTDDDSQRTFATSWSIQEASRGIDLIVAAAFEEQVMPITPGYFFPLNFWEGTCTVTGTIDGVPVSGKAYAELTHSW